MTAYGNITAKPARGIEMMKASEYRCANCNGVFEKGWSEEEARSELNEAFAVPIEECELVCDDCYKQIMAWHDKPTTQS